MSEVNFITLKDVYEEDINKYIVEITYANGWYHIFPMTELRDDKETKELWKYKMVTVYKDACLYTDTAFPNAINVSGVEIVKNGIIVKESEKTITINGNFKIHW